MQTIKKPYYLLPYLNNVTYAGRTIIKIVSFDPAYSSFPSVFSVDRINSSRCPKCEINTIMG